MATENVQVLEDQENSIINSNIKTQDTEMLKSSSMKESPETNENKENNMDQVLSQTPEKDIETEKQPSSVSNAKKPVTATPKITTPASINKPLPGKRNATTPKVNLTKTVHSKTPGGSEKIPTKLEDSLKKTSEKSITKSNKFVKVCMLCHNKIEKDQKKRLLACAHRFHEVNPLKLNSGLHFKSQ